MWQLMWTYFNILISEHCASKEQIFCKQSTKINTKTEELLTAILEENYDNPNNVETSWNICVMAQFHVETSAVPFLRELCCNNNKKK